MNVTITPDNLIPENMPKQQGSKYHKAEIRMTMAFTPENSDFLRTVSESYKVNVTALVNRIIQLFREQNPEIVTTGESYNRIQETLQTKKEANHEAASTETVDG